MKKFILACFGWLLLAAPAALQAQYTWTTNNGAITIIGYTGSGGNVTIPAMITGLPVTGSTLITSDRSVFFVPAWEREWYLALDATAAAHDARDAREAAASFETLRLAVMTVAQKGIKLQRFKGLGEMNPEQLWETTLDINARSLLQVKRQEGDEADDLFTKLMGDVVEPRREFIQANALSVANLDV